MNRARICLVVLVIAAGMVVVPPSAGSQQTPPPSPVDELISECPTAAQIAAIDAVVTITLDSDPTAGQFVCLASQGSKNLTRLQERTYQALRVMQATPYSRPLPWTAKDLYTWFADAVTGIRYRADLENAFCCSPAGVINIPVSSNSDYLKSILWTDTQNGGGLMPLHHLLVHEARHADGGHPHTCGTNDETLEQLGAYGVAWYMQAWNAMYTGAFFNDGPFNSYRFNAFAVAAGGSKANYCQAPSADLTLQVSSPAEVVQGANFTVTVTLTNTGPAASPDTYFMFQLPHSFNSQPAGIGPHTTAISATTTKGSCIVPGSDVYKGSFSCAMGEVANGGTVTMTFTMKAHVKPGSTIQNQYGTFAAIITTAKDVEANSYTWITATVKAPPSLGPPPLPSPTSTTPTSPPPLPSPTSTTPASPSPSPTSPSPPPTTSPEARTLTLSLHRHLIAKGLLTALSLDCSVGSLVKVDRVRPSGTINIGSDSTNSNGRFRVALPDKPGRYVARAEGSESCSSASSQKVRHQHQ